MKKLVSCIAVILLALQIHAQFISSFHPQEEPTGNIQYFKPHGNLFVGDCIPFYLDGTYYLYWLLDSGHHSALGGLGGHQWALSTSTDLKTWKHYPVVLGIDEDWEKSICTGSVVYYNKTFYAFYATRLIDSAGKVNEQLSYATSPDGIHFTKQKPNPFYTSAPGYSKRNFRDPKVIVDSTGLFHLFVSSAQEPSPVADGGALVHLTSRDLKTWAVGEPLIYGQVHVPECPDYFYWKGWYYIVYGQAGNTVYLKSKHAYGPWGYPRYQALDEDWVNVAKTAQFTNGRRIVAGWVPSKKDSKDRGNEIFGGNIIIRELKQDADGTLATGWAPETLPATGVALPLKSSTYSIDAAGGLKAAFIDNIPTDCMISFDVLATGNIQEYGLYLRSNNTGSDAYRLSFSPNNREVSLHESTIKAVDGLDKKIKITVVMKGDIIDVNIDGRRCIVNRLYEKKGTVLGLFARHGKVNFSNVKVQPLSGY